MSARRSLISLLPLVAASACMLPQRGSGPQPAAIILRVIGPDSLRRVGNLLLFEGDSLLVYDARTKQSFAVRDSSGMALDIYRGQQSGIKSAAKGAGKGALIGAGIGVLAGVLGAGLVSGSDFWQPVDLPEALVAGALLGASGGAVIGAFEGDPLWERITVLGLKRELCHCDNPKKP
jgi:hypothetical protein